VAFFDFNHYSCCLFSEADNLNIMIKRAFLGGILGLAAISAQSQGYIVPNGVSTNVFPREITVWNPGPQSTGFSLQPIGIQAPSLISNIFAFTEPATIGVRVFLVSSNDLISLQPILAMSYPELLEPGSYIFQSKKPFYVGLYTGESVAPPYPAFPPYQYLNPVFGWARLVNQGGHIEVLESALAHQAGGIYAGTLNIIDVPEPGTGFLLICASAFFCCWGKGLRF
jgi:hypothetical protein